MHQGDSLHTSMMEHTNTHIHTRSSVASGYVEPNTVLPVWDVSFYGTFFFPPSKIKIPGKGVVSGHVWGGDGRRLLNAEQRRRREVHPRLPDRREES